MLRPSMTGGSKRARHVRGRERRRERRRERQEGAALLVIMLIIIITTAAAAVSVQNTTSEARVAGRELMMIHARYSSEAALATTIAWLDIIGGTPDFLNLWESWAAMAPPEMRVYTAGHSIEPDASRHMAARSMQPVQMMLPHIVEPISRASIADPIPDATGSFGPRQVYEPEPYVVDLTDCLLAPAALSPGNQTNATTSGQTPKQFYCVLTVRGRLSVPAVGGVAMGAGKFWSPGGSDTIQDRSGVAHDARASVLTPAMLISN